MIFGSPGSFWSEVIHENYCRVYLYKSSKPLFHSPINLHRASLAQATSSMAGKVPHNGVNPAQRDSWELLHKHTHELSAVNIEKGLAGAGNYKMQFILYTHTHSHTQAHPQTHTRRYMNTVLANIYFYRKIGNYCATFFIS